MDDSGQSWKAFTYTPFFKMFYRQKKGISWAIWLLSDRRAFEVQTSPLKNAISFQRNNDDSKMIISDFRQ